MKRFFRRLSLWVRPPKVGDTYAGNNKDFVIYNQIESVLFGVLDKYGNPNFVIIPGKHTYKITIEQDVGLYFKCNAYALSATNDFSSKTWLVRSQSRRITKDKLNELILSGKLKREQSLS